MQARYTVKQAQDNCVNPQCVKDYDNYLIVYGDMVLESQPSLQAAERALGWVNDHEQKCEKAGCRPNGVTVYHIEQILK